VRRRGQQPCHGGVRGGGGGSRLTWWGRKKGQVGCVGQNAEQAGGWLGHFVRNLKENSFRNKILIFEYNKALEICIRRFRRNFDMGIFPEFF
jgi:hypothetical protein